MCAILSPRSRTAGGVSQRRDGRAGRAALVEYLRGREWGMASYALATGGSRSLHSVPWRQWSPAGAHPRPRHGTASVQRARANSSAAHPAPLGVAPGSGPRHLSRSSCAGALRFLKDVNRALAHEETHGGTFCIQRFASNWQNCPCGGASVDATLTLRCKASIPRQGGYWITTAVVGYRFLPANPLRADLPATVCRALHTGRRWLRNPGTVNEA